MRHRIRTKQSPKIIDVAFPIRRQLFRTAREVFSQTVRPSVYPSICGSFHHERRTPNLQQALQPAVTAGIEYIPVGRRPTVERNQNLIGPGFCSQYPTWCSINRLNDRSTENALQVDMARANSSTRATVQRICRWLNARRHSLYRPEAKDFYLKEFLHRATPFWKWQ
jgi:hypothetical protein